MTYKEKFIKEHPEVSDEVDLIVFNACPYDYDYEKARECEKSTLGCAQCWDREVVVERELSPQEKLHTYIYEQMYKRKSNERKK